MINNDSKYGIMLYFLLIFATFFVPRGLMNFTYNYFLLVVGFYIVSWIMILVYLHRNNKSDYDYQMYDFLIFDLLYIFGLPIILYSIMFNLGEDIWQYPVLEKVYLTCLIFIGSIKVITFRTKHSGIVQFSILVFFPLANLIIINQIFSIWYIIN